MTAKRIQVLTDPSILHGKCACTTCICNCSPMLKPCITNPRATCTPGSRSSNRQQLEGHVANTHCLAGRPQPGLTNFHLLHNSRNKERSLSPDRKEGTFAILQCCYKGAAARLSKTPSRHDPAPEHWHTRHGLPHAVPASQLPTPLPMLLPESQPPTSPRLTEQENRRSPLAPLPPPPPARFP